MTDFYALPTLLGQAAIAAAVDGGSPLSISQMIVGDGNGSAVTPVETWAGLIRARATVPISQSSRNGNQVTFEASLDETVGGFTVREVGLIDAAGRLLFVASVPATEKLTVAQGAYDHLTIGLVVVISDTAQIVLEPPASSLDRITDGLRLYFVAVNSATVAEPPASKSAGDTYLVPANGSGQWASQRGVIAQWTGETWVYQWVPVGHVIGASDTGRYWRKGAEEWSLWHSTQTTHALTRLATIPETRDASRGDIAVTPEGLRSLVRLAPAFMAVKSATTLVPPATPANGDLYLVPLSATGDWSGRSNKLAEWTGAGWRFDDMPRGHVLAASDTGDYWHLDETWSVWRASTAKYGITRLATIPEARAGERNDVAVTPEGLAAVIDELGLGTSDDINAQIFGFGLFEVFGEPGVHTFKARRTGWHRVSVVGAGRSGGPTHASGGSSSFGAFLSASGGGASAGAGYGGSVNRIGGIGGAGSASAGGGGGSAGTQLGNGKPGKAAVLQTGGGGAGVGDGLPPLGLRHDVSGGGLSGDAIWPAADRAMIRSSRFPFDAFQGGFLVAATPARDGEGGAGLGLMPVGVHYAGDGGVGGGGGGVGNQANDQVSVNAGKGGIGGGGGGRGPADGGSGGGYARKAIWLNTGDTVPVTVGAGGRRNEAGGGGDGLVTVEW